MRHLHDSYFAVSFILFSGIAIAAEAGNAERHHRASISTLDTSYWQTQTTGITGETLFAVSVVDRNVCWLACTPGTIIRTVDGGNTWVPANSPSMQSIFGFDGVSDSIAFASTTRLDLGTFIHRTTNAGSSWQVVYSQPEDIIFAIRMFNPTSGLAIGDPVNGWWRILKTTNGGETWFRIPMEPPQIGGGSGGTHFGTFDTSYVWFFDNAGRWYLSSNGGETWSNYSGSATGAWLLWMNTPNLWLMVGPNQGSMYVYRWELGWTVVGPTPGFPYPPTGLVGALATREFWLVQGAIYYTPNAGDTWTLATPSGLNRRTTMIDMVTLGSEVSAWAIGIGDTVYHFHRTLTGVDEHPQPTPREFSLIQNYPNPFNPSTNIQFEVPVSGFVSLKVYNVCGQEVATLVNKEFKPGRYKITWDAIDVPSGVYFYRLHAGSYVQTKKLILVR